MDVKQHVQNIILTDDEICLKKAILYHLLEDDYDRISELRENYPVSEMLYILGVTNSVVEIDLNKLFGF